MRSPVRRSATVVAALVPCASFALVGGAQVAAGAPTRASMSTSMSTSEPDEPTASAAGLEQTWETSQGTWVAIAMGHLGNRTNTFWQLLFRPAGTTRWSLATPPGVASNGGFSVDSAPGPTGTVVAGFQPSKYLLYSPLAETTDHGEHWRAGTLRSALVYSADAVATGSGVSHAGTSGSGTVLALVRSGRGTLVRSDGSLTRWSTVATAATLGVGAAGRACKVLALTAVVLVAAGSPEVGTDCARRGVVGLFRETRGRWLSSAPRIPGSASLTLSIVRLWSDAAGTTVLIERRGAGRSSLVVAWQRSTGTRWTVSAPIAFSGDVLSTATGAGSSVAVVTSDGWKAHAVMTIAGAGSRWRSEGRPPKGTQAVAFTGPDLVALAVHDSRVSVFQDGGAAGRWHETAQRFTVPIEYGSST